jgi:group I intron endonuclease
MFIYKITNLINNKIYIGRTIQKLSYRWTQHKQSARNGCNFILHRAIRKYGVENFIFEQIDTAINLTELLKKESFYIKELNSLKPNGYNILECDVQGPNFIPWNKGKKTSLLFDFKKFDRPSRSGTKNSFYGKHHTEESLQKMSNSHKKFFEKIENREKLSLIHKKRWESSEKREEMAIKKGAKPFIIFKYSTMEQLGTYTNANQCAKDFDLWPSSICHVLNNRRKQTNGYTLKYIEQGE